MRTLLEGRLSGLGLPFRHSGSVLGWSSERWPSVPLASMFLLVSAAIVAVVAIELATGWRLRAVRRAAADASRVIRRPAPLDIAEFARLAKIGTLSGLARKDFGANEALTVIETDGYSDQLVLPDLERTDDQAGPEPAGTHRLSSTQAAACAEGDPSMAREPATVEFREGSASRPAAGADGRYSSTVLPQRGRFAWLWRGFRRNRGLGIGSGTGVAQVGGTGVPAVSRSGEARPPGQGGPADASRGPGVPATAEVVDRTSPPDGPTQSDSTPVPSVPAGEVPDSNWWPGLDPAEEAELRAQLAAAALAELSRLSSIDLTAKPDDEDD
jgi:hypothetical protein